MAFCIGGKACRRAQCKDRCRSWFSAQPDLERACKNACKGNSSLSKEEFLCSGNYFSEAAYIALYGTDPCGGGVVIDEVLDPLNDRAREEKEWQDVQPVLLGIGILIAAALIILYLIKKG